jgi:formate/nitrite transporter FocA (FNT family)
VDDDPSRSAKIAAILNEARKTRRAPSRSIWIIASIIGVACAIAFVVLMLSGGEAAKPKPAASEPHGFGFTAGLALGIIVGAAIGFAVARQRDHSSRNKP